jgi:hypothetical protein
MKIELTRRVARGSSVRLYWRRSDGESGVYRYDRKRESDVEAEANVVAKFGGAARSTANRDEANEPEAPEERAEAKESEAAPRRKTPTPKRKGD